MQFDQELVRTSTNCKNHQIGEVQQTLNRDSERIQF